MKELIKQLNILLASTQVFLMNARAYHWNVKSQHFFILHEKFGELYDGLSSDADVIAERIRAFDEIPVHKYSEYLKITGIPETKALTADEMLSEIISSLQSTEKQLNIVRKAAVAIDDEATNTLMGDMLLAVQKLYWMYTSTFGISTRKLGDFLKNS